MNAVPVMGAPSHGMVARLRESRLGAPARHPRKATPMNTTPSSTPHISSTTTSDGIAAEGTSGHANWPRSSQQADATRPAGGADQRALVLAGGGAAGSAGEVGLIAGVSDARGDGTEAH